MINKKIAFNVNDSKKDFKHFFRATGYANADYTYVPSVRRMYDYLSSYANHPMYMRLHNIMTLHGKGDYYKVELGLDYGNPISNVATGVDIVVKKDASGKLSYDWTYVDKVYDIIIEHEMKPIVEMVYIPTAIMDSKYNCLPENYKEYYECVRQFVLHWYDRYGKEEVRSWYFEVINEPENYDIVNEDPSTFMALYDHFEAAVHSVDPELRAGGPAVKQWDSGKRIFDLFLRHCSSGINYVDGKFGTRLDFISVHCKAGYPTMVGPQMDYMFNSLRDYAAILKKYEKFEKLPFFNDESDIVWEGNMGIAFKSWLNFRNNEYAAGFICKMMNYYCDVIEDELGLNLTVVDSDNSHLPWEVHLFSGNRSQLTPLNCSPSEDIIRKSMFNAGQLLGRLGNKRFIIKSDDEEFGIKYGCLATEFEGCKGYAFMLWNFEDGLDRDVNERSIELNVSGIDEKCSYKVITYRIDEKHSNAYYIYKQMGLPFPLTSEQAAELRLNDSLEPEQTVADFKGKEFTAAYKLPMHSVVLVILTEESDEKEKNEITALAIGKDAFGNNQVFVKWNYSKRRDFVGYNLYRNGVKLNSRLITGSCLSDSILNESGCIKYQVETIYAGESYLSSEKSVTI